MQAKTGFGGFGAGGGGFGAMKPVSGFGAATTGSGFGAVASTGGGFGAPAASTGGFGAATGGGGFGTAPTTGGGFGATKPVTGFGAAAGGAGGFGSVKAPTGGFGAAAGSGAFGFGTGTAAKSSFGFQAGAGAAAGGAGVGAGTARVGFGFGTGQPQGNALVAGQQMQIQQQHILTEEQQRQNKLDRILEKQGKLENLLPTPGVADKRLATVPVSKQQMQTQQYQSRGQSLPHGTSAASDAASSRGRPLSSGIIGTGASSGRHNPLMSPEVLLGRRAKKLTIDHSQYEDLTEGLPSPYSGVAGHKKQLARSVDQATLSAESLQRSNNHGTSLASSSFANNVKRSKHEDQEGAWRVERTGGSPVQPQFSRHARAHVHFGSSPEPAGGPECMEEDEDGQDGQEEVRRERHSLCPRLTKEGYFTRPDMAILQAMGPPELASVPNFTVYVPNTGSITWKHRTDVRGLDLDALVSIEPKVVTVYPEGTPKPPEGTGLNKSAEITLYNIFPKANSSQGKQLNFVNKLRMSNESTDATFESYNLETGTWVFSTEHFSKHGLADSDSDSEEEEEQDQEDEEDAHGMSLALQLPPVSSNNTSTGTSKPLSLLAKAPKRGSVSDFEARSPTVPLAGGAVRRNTDYRSLQRIKGNVVARTAQEDPRDAQRRELQGGSEAYAHLLNASTHFQPPPEQARPEGDMRHSDIESLRGFSSSPGRAALRKDTFKPATQPLMRASSSKPDMSFVEAGAHSSRTLFAVESSPCMRLMKTVKDSLSDPLQHRDAPCGSTSMRPVTAGRPQRPVDAALYMGRSFRAGWSSDGKLLHVGTVNFNKLPTEPSETVSTFTDGRSPNGAFVHGEVRVQAIDSMRHHGSESFELIPRLLASLLKSSLSSVPPEQQQQQQRQNMKNLVPMWSLPKADVNQWDEYIRFVNLLKVLLDDVAEVGGAYERNHPAWIISRVVTLLDAMCGQEEQWIRKFKSSGESDYMMPLYESRGGGRAATSLWERRRELLSTWLKSICEDDLDPSVENIHLADRPESVILSLLSCGRMEDAAEVAERAHMFRLAMLLCQAASDSELTAVLAQQVDLWEHHGAGELMSEDLLDVYKVLGGKYKDDRSVLEPLDWPNAIGVLFWFCNSSVGTLAEALVNFDTVRCSNENIRFPLLRQDEGAEEEEVELQLDGAAAESRFHALYRLLEVFFVQDEDEEGEEGVSLWAKAVASLRPRGYSTDMLDYRGPFLTLVFLEATSVLRQSEGSVAAAVVRQHMVGQLLSQGEWGWAVFVCMQIEDPYVRSHAVRDLVLRFGGGDVCEEQQLALVKTQFLVPELLLIEAAAYRHSYAGEVNDEATHLHMCGLWREAATLICRDIAPRALFGSTKSAALVQPLLQYVEDSHELLGKEVEQWNTQGGSLLSFFDFKERAMAMDESDADATAELVEDACCLLDQLSLNAFGLFSSTAPSSSRRDFRLLANVVVNDMGTFLCKTIVRHWARDESLLDAARLRQLLRRGPVLEDCRREVLRLFPALQQPLEHDLQ